MKYIISFIILLLSGCAHTVSPSSSFKHTTKIADLNDDTKSVCLEGMLRILNKHFKCQHLAIEPIAPGVTKFLCADQGSELSKQSVLNMEYFMIAINPSTGKLAVTPTKNLFPVCADPKLIIFASQRD